MVALSLQGQRVRVDRPRKSLSHESARRMARRRPGCGVTCFLSVEEGQVTTKEECFIPSIVSATEEKTLSAVAEGDHTRPLPRDVENRADDPSLNNPLKRMERLGTGWMGVIFELEGVCVEYEKKDSVVEAWRKAAEMEGKEAPMKWQLDRAIGMKNEQAVQEAFCWTRNPQEAKRIGQVKEQIMSDLLADAAPVAPQSAVTLLKSLGSLDVPTALVSSAPEQSIHKILELSGMEGLFDVVVSGEDVYRGKPDPEGYLYAAQRMDRPPFRCVVVGNNNSSIEAAHEVGMQCVVVVGPSSPLYEVSAADLAVKSLDDISFMNFKNLFGTEISNVQFDLEEDGETNQ
jgi:HAD superfamily hydrolase (TIGR01509 family)